MLFFFWTPRSQKILKNLFLGEIRDKGMVLPMNRDIYRPVLKRLESLGFAAKAHTTKL